MNAFAATQLASLNVAAQAADSGLVELRGDQTARGCDCDPVAGLDAALAAAIAATVPIIDESLDAVWLVDETSLCIVAANIAADTLFAVEPEALIGRSVLQLAASPEDVAFWADPRSRAEARLWSDSQIRRDDGRVIPVTRKIGRLSLEGGSVFIVTLHDCSRERRIESQLEAAVTDLAATLESSPDGLLIADLDGRIRQFNQRFATLWSLPSDLLTQRDDTAISEWMAAQVADRSAYLERLALVDSSQPKQLGEAQSQSQSQAIIDSFAMSSGRTIERSVLPHLTRGELTGRLYSFRDITERAEAQRRIEALSHTDELTGLPNRRLLSERLKHALAVGTRDGTPFAVLFLDLDRFKHINDSFGHAFGDRVLLETTTRIQSCLRAVDTVARPSGDEFVMLVHEADNGGAEASARRVLDAMQPPFVLDGVTVTVTCSIGIALFPSDALTAEALISTADTAMYRVKTMGRSGYRFFRQEEDMHLTLTLPGR